jgi:hypothetical protein
VEIVGMLAGHRGQTQHRILVYTNEAASLADAAIFLEVVQDGHRLVLGQFAAVQGRALAFGKALLAGATGEDTVGFVGAVAEKNP